MKNIYIQFAFLFLSIQTSLLAQNSQNTDHFSHLVREAEGDLNKDGLADRVTVCMDTLDETRPFLLQIFLSQPTGNLTLAVASTQIIEPQYPAELKGESNGYQIPDIQIEKGNLVLWSEIKGGNITYEFAYQNGNFELVSVEKLINNASEGYVDANTIFTKTKFNLVSGIKIETDETDAVKKSMNKSRKTTRLIRPLPQLQDFNYSDKEKY